MKNISNLNKNSTWLSLTVITFLLFIIGLFAIGFEFDKSVGIETVSTIKTAIDNGAASFYKSAYALFVCALLFSAASIALVITKWVLDELNIKTKLPQKYWDVVFMATIGLAAIFIIAGASVYISQKIKVENVSVNSGRASGLFILVILVLPLDTIPFFMSNVKEEEIVPTPTSSESDSASSESDAPVNDKQ